MNDDFERIWKELIEAFLGKIPVFFWRDEK
jgi:hypothetical protein